MTLEETNKEKQDLIDNYKITKQWLDLYEPFYSTYVARAKRNEEIADELYYRWGIRMDFMEGGDK